MGIGIAKTIMEYLKKSYNEKKKEEMEREAQNALLENPAHS